LNWVKPHGKRQPDEKLEPADYAKQLRAANVLRQYLKVLL
jgi:hypothetical protein